MSELQEFEIPSVDTPGDLTSALAAAFPECACILRNNQLIWASDAFAEMLAPDGGITTYLNDDLRPFFSTEQATMVAELSDKIMSDHVEEQLMTVNITVKVPSGGDLKTKVLTGRCCKIIYQGTPAIYARFIDNTQASEDLQEQARRAEIFQSAFRLVPDLFMVVNSDTHELLEVNPAFVNATGFRRDEVIGNLADSLGIWADPTFFGRFFEELKTNTSMSDIPVVLKTRGGVIRHFRMFAQNIVEPGQSALVVLVAQDVTDDLIRAQELQKSRDTAELANRAKSEFLANMSHELRTPLNAILGFAEIIRDRIFGKEEQDRYCSYAADIHDSGGHLLSIINDILDLSKIEAGRHDAQLSWIDPTPALDMCIGLIQQRAFENGLALHTDIDDGIEIEADERLIKQIALNLLSNAVKFTEEGGEIRLVLERDTDGSTVLAIEDTGIGMTADEIRIAKRPFGQVDSSLSRRHQGSGLGLPLVAAFAEEIKATMTIHSIPQKGTRVSITFPPEKSRTIASGADGSAPLVL